MNRLLVLGLAVGGVALPLVSQPEWPAWRGPDGTGHASGGHPPLSWSEQENVRWKTAIPGLGLSSPIVHGDRVYVTTAIATDREGEATSAEARDPNAEPVPTTVHEFAVLAIDRADGTVAWRTVVNRVVPHEGGHATNSQASISPVTDGELLWVSFGSHGLYCLGLDGAVLWSKDLGRMRTRRQYGEGSSPVVYGDSLVVNQDHEGDSFVAVLDKSTGDERWRRPRDEVTSWSTPVVVPVDGRPQVIIAATSASRGYDLGTGDEVWSLPGMTVNCIPTPPHRDGVVYLMSGYRGQMLQAVRLASARGDLLGTDHVSWTHRSNTSYVPSALLYDHLLYFLRGNYGVLSCLDSRTGEVLYQGQKLPGVRSVYASPVGVDGRVYVTSRDGNTVVVRHGPEFEILAINRIDDEVDASMALVGDEIYLRGRRSLYCLAEPAPERLPSSLAALGRTAEGERVALPDATLFVPEGYVVPEDGEVPLFVHFQGGAVIAEENFARMQRPGVLIASTLEGRSSAFAKPYGDPAAFGDLLVAGEAALGERAGRKVHFAPITVTFFSAGYGAVRELLAVPEHYERIQTLVSADSIYASVVSGEVRAPHAEQMVDFMRFAQAAARGEKTFVLVHGMYATDYASTAECADLLLASVALKREANPMLTERGVPIAQQAHAGNFHLLTSLEATAGIHVDCLYMIPELVRRYAAR